MINRWQGNSGRVQRLPEQGDRRPPQHSAPQPNHSAAKAPQSVPAQRPPQNHRPPNKNGGILSGLDSLKKLIPGKTEELETEDIILLLILYLMYRESGDSELLMIMGAMFLL